MSSPHGATWRSGYATVCKTVYSGSIPDVASTFEINDLAQLAQNRGRFSIPQKSVRVRSKAYVARSIDLMM